MTNMHMERELATARQASPTTLLFAERVCGAALLAQVRTRHKTHGGRDVTAVSRGMLLEENVPIAAATCRPAAMPTRARGHLRLMKTKLKQERVQKCRALSKSEARDVRARACEEYRGLDMESRKALQNEAVDDARARRAGVCEDSPSASSEFEKRRGDFLWGLSSFDSPLDVVVAENLIKDTLGCDEVLCGAGRGAGVGR